MMSDRKIMFLGEFYPQEVKQQRYQIIENLSREIVRGAENRYGKKAYENPVFSRFEASIAACTFPFFRSNPKMPKNWRAETGDTYSLLAAAYNDAMSWLRASIIATPFFGVPDFENRFREQFSTVDFSWGASVEPTLEGAYEMARLNFAATETRILSITVLKTLLRRSEFNQVNIDGAEEIRDAFWQQRNAFMRDMLVFGAMIGGEAHTKAVKLAINQTMYDPKLDVNYSIIEYLQPNGRSPGSWPTSVDEKFRAAIKAGYEAL